MPLIRYELRCEHGLANPELYRAPATTASHDSKALLEGVAVAGLVGIVRQLGDLAEFAAEIFHDLHEQLKALKVRGDGLTTRLVRLETKLPAVEKALRTSTDQFRYAYLAGIQWHPSFQSYQNHCTKSEFPNFIHNYYQNCHGPPRLFLLDKFDEGGEGACMKRYTDPSFYKRVHIQSQTEKEKDRWNGNGKEISVLGPSHYFRSSNSHVEGGSSICTKEEDDASGVVDPLMHMEQDQHLELTAENNIPIAGGDGDDTHAAKTSAIDDDADQVPKVSSSQEDSVVQNHTEVEGKISLKEEKEHNEEDYESASSDDGEQFVDALTTMDSVSETESEDSETQALHDPHRDAVVSSALTKNMVHVELAREEVLSEDDDGLEGKKKNLDDRTSIEKEVLEASQSSLEGLKLQEEDMMFRVEKAASETQALLHDPDRDAVMESSLSNSAVMHTEESPSLEKELPPKQALNLEGCLKLQEEEDLVGLRENDLLGFTPISLLEVDDDLGYEKYSPLCSLTGSTPSHLNHFAHKTHMNQTSPREKKKKKKKKKAQEEEALDLQEKLPERKRAFEERLQEGFDLNNKESNSTCMSSVQAPHVQESKPNHESVNLPEAPESLSDHNNATQNGDADSQDSRSTTVLNKTQIVEQIDKKKETNSIPYSAVPNGISGVADTMSTTDDYSEYRKSIDEPNHHPFSSSSSPMSHTMSESPSGRSS